jgi:hypothetical protein
VVLIGLVLGLRGRTRDVEYNGVEVEARRWIGEHTTFIAKALLHERGSEPFDCRTSALWDFKGRDRPARRVPGRLTYPQVFCSSSFR